LSSLREHLRSVGIPCYIEKKIEKKQSGHKTPDLLICSNNYLVVDHKYTESANALTLSGKIEEMKEYDTTFVFESTEFKPEVVMLVPTNVVTAFKKILDCPITWGYILDEDIIISQSIGSVQDSRVIPLFNPNLFFSKAKEVSKYKFIISHSPLPYTACQVYTILWALHPPFGYFASEFSVEYDVILSSFNDLFPPWISSEVQQLQPKRLKKSLGLLEDIGWIKWLEIEKKVIVSKTTGRLTADTMENLIDRHTENEFAKKVKEYEKERAESEKLAKGFEQKELSDYT